MDLYLHLGGASHSVVSIPADKKIMHVISDFRVKDKAELYQRLDAAVKAAQTHALVDGVAGVLVTSRLQPFFRQHFTKRSVWTYP